MIRQVRVYTIVCDNCGVDINKDTEYIGWDSVEGAELTAEANNFLTKGEKHYCPNCYTFDDDNELMLRKIQNETHKTSLKISNNLIERLKLDETLLKKVVDICEEINKLNVE